MEGAFYLLLRYIKRRRCVHKWSDVGTQVVEYSVGIGKYERTETETQHVIYCGKCDTTKYFESTDKLRVFKKIAEIKEIYSR